MVQSPSWKAKWFAVSHGITPISRNQTFRYRTHKTLPNFSILAQPNPVHTPKSHLLQIHPNIIHPSRPMCPQWSLSPRFPQQCHIRQLSSPITLLTNSLWCFVDPVLIYVSAAGLSILVWECLMLLTESYCGECPLYELLWIILSNIILHLTCLYELSYLVTLNMWK